MFYKITVINDSELSILTLFQKIWVDRFSYYNISNQFQYGFPKNNLAKLYIFFHFIIPIKTRYESLQ